MIVDPDFFDHWKTLLLVESLGDKCAPLYVLRLWAHCQNRRRAEFDNLTDRALKAICRYDGHANKLLAALEDSGFVRRVGESSLEVCGWCEYNAKLIANWDNGAKGGRPKKPAGNPRGTQQKPNENPTETHEEPIRVDEIGEEETRDNKQNKRPGKHSANESFGKAFTAFVAQSIGNHNWPCDEHTQFAWLYELDRYPVEDAIEMLRYSTQKGAKSPIMNGDHKRSLITTSTSGGRRFGRKTEKELFGDE